MSINLGLKERAKLGDVQAIKQLLDVALIHRNAKTLVRLQNKELFITVESEQEPDQQRVILAVKRQLNLLNSSVFDTVKVIGITTNQQEVWNELIIFSKVETKNTVNFSRKTTFEFFREHKRITSLIGTFFSLLLLFSWCSRSKLAHQQIHLDSEYLEAFEAMQDIENSIKRGITITEYDNLLEVARMKLEQIPLDQSVDLEQLEGSLVLVRSASLHAIAYRIWECEETNTSSELYIKKCQKGIYEFFLSDEYAFPLEKEDPLRKEIYNSGEFGRGDFFYDIDSEYVIQELWKRAELGD